MAVRWAELQKKPESHPINKPVKVIKKKKQAQSTKPANKRWEQIRSENEGGRS